MLNNFIAFGLIIGLGFSFIGSFSDIYQLTFIGIAITIPFLITGMIRTMKYQEGYSILIILGYITSWILFSRLDNSGKVRIGDLVIIVPIAIAVLYSHIAIVIILFKSQNNIWANENSYAKSESWRGLWKAKKTELKKQPNKHGILNVSEREFNKIVNDITSDSDKIR